MHGGDRIYITHDLKVVEVVSGERRVLSTNLWGVARLRKSASHFAEKSRV